MAFIRISSVKFNEDYTALTVSGISEGALLRGNRPFSLDITSEGGLHKKFETVPNKDGSFTFENVDVAFLSQSNGAFELTIEGRAELGDILQANYSGQIEVERFEPTLDSTAEVDNANAQLDINGTSKDLKPGTEVTITITDAKGNKVEKTTTIDAEGNYTLNDVDVSGLIDGKLVVDTKAKDKNGNPVTDKDIVELDAVQASIDTIPTLGDDADIINITGKSVDVPEGSKVTITLTDTSGQKLTVETVVDANGNYKVDGIDVSKLANGKLEIDTVATDNNGKPVTDNDVVDFNVVPAQLDSTPVVDNAGKVVNITGTSVELPQGTKVNITITDVNGKKVTATTEVDANGNYKVNGIDVSKLANGKLVIDTVATDKRGNPVTDKDLADLAMAYDRYVDMVGMDLAKMLSNETVTYESYKRYSLHKDLTTNPNRGYMTDDNNDHITMSRYMTNRSIVKTYGGDDVVRIGTNMDLSTVDLGEGNNVLTLGHSNIDGYITNKSTVLAGSGNDFLSVRTNIDTSTVNLGDGNNKIIVGGYVTNAYTTITTGSGDDTLLVGTNIAGATVNLGEGENFIKVGGYITAGADIITGAGNDYVSVGTNIAGSTVNLGEGENVINVGGYITAKSEVITGAGNDVLSVGTNVDGSTLNLGDGDNTITVGGYVTNSNVVTGSGNDVVKVAGQVFNGSSINTGAGNDEIFIGSLQNAKINGGEGYDVLHITGQDKDISFSNILNVEHIDLGNDIQWLKGVNYQNMINSGVKTLHIEGDFGDRVYLGTTDAINNTADRSAGFPTAWQKTNAVTENGVTYDVYTNAMNTDYKVYIDQDITVY